MIDIEPICPVVIRTRELDAKAYDVADFARLLTAESDDQVRIGMQMSVRRAMEWAIRAHDQGEQPIVTEDGDVTQFGDRTTRAWKDVVTALAARDATSTLPDRGLLVEAMRSRLVREDAETALAAARAAEGGAMLALAGIR